MRNRRYRAIPGLIVILLIAAAFWFTRKYSSKTTKGSDHIEYNTSLNRDINRLSYSKHARCRMLCRQIDSSEVEEILMKGSVNIQKSDTIGSRDPKFALEGRTHDGQRVRIIFAIAPSKTVVVTAIDLDQDINCTCP